MDRRSLEEITHARASLLRTWVAGETALRKELFPGKEAELLEEQANNLMNWLVNMGALRSDNDGRVAFDKLMMHLKSRQL